MRGTKRVYLHVLLMLIPLVCVQQGAQAIGIRPHRVDVTLPLGGEEVVEVTLANSSSMVKHVAVSLVGVRSLQDGSIVWLSTEGTDEAGTSYPYACIGACASLETSSLTIAPGSETTLSLRVRAPDTLEPGDFAGRVGALWFDVREGAAGTLFDSLVRYVCFVLIEFEGEQRRVVELTAMNARQDALGEIAFPVLALNTGNVHLSPDWQATIRDTSSEEIVERLYVPSGTLLPGCPRDVAAIWSAASVRDGLFDVEFSLWSDDALLAEAVLAGIHVESGVIVSPEL